MAKKQPKAGKQYRIMSIRWEESEYQELVKYASEHGINPTQYVRMRSLKLSAKKAVKPAGNPDIAEQAQAGGIAKAKKQAERMIDSSEDSTS